MTKSKFFLAVAITTVLGITLILLSIVVGKNELFLILNGNLGSIGDFIFKYATYLGDGIIWIPVGIWVLIYHRQKWVLLFSLIIISTAFVNMGKFVLMPEEPRPYAAIENKQAIHTVSGVDIHTIYSFPSGHTTTAFSVYLLLLVLTDSAVLLVVGLILAAMAGYSRIYLAQHFPLDVGAGMITAVIAVLISKYLEEKLRIKK
ncbi:MAG: phosphatase PAP2 family protein [Sediminibacterium sp.]|jgi:membrane-associated phospholipid phosphatase|nr:phosphatase PAP2 family protein [Chitinophagaceae bacterium]MCA6445643.1 phosphatase PAP2 family protein [Chitinophagaceae bacterium]